MKTIGRCNEIGVRWSDDDPSVHVKEVRVYEECGSVQLWFESTGLDFLVYLTPQEAMSFSRAFERCAISSLKNWAV